MQLEGRVLLLHRTKQVLVPFERQVWIVAALEQQLPTAQRDRLVDLPEDLLEPEHVAFRRTHRTIKGTEVTARHADVRVIDVAIDDVSDDLVGVLASAHGVSQFAKERRRRMQVQLERLRPIEPASASNL